jgi:hypothetical protein
MQASNQAEQIRKLKAHVKALSLVVRVLLELLPDKHPGKKLERSLESAGFLQPQGRENPTGRVRSQAA